MSGKCKGEKNGMNMNLLYKDRYLFGGNREKAIKRDGYKCVICGMTRDEHMAIYGHDITVDHKDRKGRGVKIKNNDISNLRTLCKSCHGREDGVLAKIKPRWQKRHLCSNGHKLSGYNLITHKSKYKDKAYLCKVCRICKNENKRIYRAKRKQLGLPHI